MGIVEIPARKLRKVTDRTRPKPEPMPEPEPEAEEPTPPAADDEATPTGGSNAGTNPRKRSPK
jgi:hypothetical protein